MTRALVAGGGLAGIAAALQLADSGVDVTLLEGRPRLGGATHSFRRGGMHVDNGQHVYLRCCTEYAGFLRRLGVAHLAPLQPRLDVPVLAPAGRRSRLARAPLPAPLHLSPSLLRYAFLGPAARVRAATAALALRRLDEDDPTLDERSFADWLFAHGQSRAAIDDFWDVVTRATLNATADHASLALAAKVFRTGLLTKADAADIGYSAVPLSRLHGDPATAALAAAGVTVRTRTKVRGVQPDGPGLRVVLDDGEELDADTVVVALPHDQAADVLPGEALPQVAALHGLGVVPIINVHVVYAERVTDLAFAAGVRSPVQWLFDRTEAAGIDSGQYLALSLSDAGPEADEPVSTLRERYLPALAELLPAAKGVPVRDFFVTRERTATFRQAPGSRRLRAGTTTAVPGLYLAGAWTDTGWPATMESAVRSGRAAAAAALSRLSGTPLTTGAAA